MVVANPGQAKTSAKASSNAWKGNKNYKPPKIPPKDLNKPKPNGRGTLYRDKNGKLRMKK
jgi:hypothetical protein